MGNNWLPWIIMLGGAVAVYFIIIKPLSNPDARKLLGAGLTGDKQVMNKTLKDLYTKYPEAQAKLRQQDPQKLRDVMAGKALYTNSIRLAI